MEKLPLVIAYGGGLNSDAVLCGLRERDIVPDLILFADTKGEHPHTYDHMRIIDAFTRLWWNLPIMTVRKLYKGEHEGLEGECIRKSLLPALAYGKKGCSVKHKIEPQTRYTKKWMDSGNIKTIRRVIGYDAGEGHRAVGKTEENLKRGRKVINWYPLIEWQWRREDCASVVKRHGIPLAMKSACFFCPSSKRSEVLRLRDEYPALLERALAMEDRAQATVTTKRGLGGERNYWREWLAADDAQFKLDLEPQHMPCGCHG